MRKYIYVFLAVVLFLSGCNNSVDPSLEASPKSPVGAIDFSSWADVDNVLVIRTGIWIDSSFCDSSSNAYALFLDNSDTISYLSAQSVLLNNEALTKSDDQTPIYYSSTTMTPVGSNSSSLWSINFQDSAYSIVQAMAARGTNINIAPYTEISKNSGMTVSWSSQGSNDSVIVQLVLNESLTEHYDPSYLATGSIEHAILSGDDNGSVTFSGADLSSFSVNVYGELTITWYKFALSSQIMNCNTILGSAYSVSIPVKIKN